MKITIESTSEIVEVNGVAARVWQGTSEAGVPVQCLIVRVAADKRYPCAEFERDLKETRSPTSADPMRAFPLRMVL
jgi:hypothetical protein